MSSMTNASSSTLCRQLAGQNIAPSFAAAASVSSTRNEFCPSHRIRSPVPTPPSDRAFARRFVRSSRSAYVRRTSRPKSPSTAASRSGRLRCCSRSTSANVRPAGASTAAVSHADSDVRSGPRRVSCRRVNTLGVIDCDQHLFESRTLWSDYADPKHREDALGIVDDPAGNAWLQWRGRRMVLADVTVPGETDEVGDRPRRVLFRSPPERPYDEALPAAYWQPSARLAELDRLGLDEAFLFPNYGLVWEHNLVDDLDATKSNMSAWNRWAVEVAAEGKERLHPVAHLTLRDLDWLDDQLRALAAGECGWRWSHPPWSTAGPCRIPTSTGRGRRSSHTTSRPSSTWRTSGARSTKPGTRPTPSRRTRCCRRSSCGCPPRSRSRTSS